MATELGKAYVQIIPSAKGISGMIHKEMGGEVASAGVSAGESLGSKMMGAVSGVIAAAGIGKAIGASITEGAALQQSLGGVETLFKDSADKVKGFANEAYKTTGLSANAYMENVTGFSASLLQSLGGDTDKAAETANMAMIDMSDNANKMGTSMESIQLAYQGFAKQNYTMLDNLKLGYGGTKQEMQRLLADAEKLTGVKYDINNLSDVYSAIHAIQENLDITGTTAREAATTFTGSFESMKAAAQNVLGKIAIGENVTPALQSLLETTKTFLFGNFLPMIGNILSGLGVVLTEGVSSLASQLFGDAFGSAVYDQIGRVTGIFQTFFDMIFGSMDRQGNIDILNTLGFSDEAATQIVNIADNIRVTFENIGSVIGNVGSIVADFVGDLLGIQGGEQGVNLLGTAFEILSSALRISSSILKEITNFFKENKLAADLLKTAVVALGVGLPVMKFANFLQGLGGISGVLGIAKTAITTFATSITAAISSIPLIGWIAAAVAALAWFFTQTETGRQIWSSFVDWIKQAWQGIADFFVGLWSGISEGASNLWVSIQEAASVAWTAITTAVMAIVQPFINGFMNIWNNISDGLAQIWEGIKMIFQGAWDFIKSIFLGAILVIIDLVTGNFTQLGADLSLIWDGIKNGVSMIWEGIKTYFSGVVDVIVGYGKATFENFSSTLSTIWKGLSDAGKAIFDGFAQILSNIWNTIKSVASSAWEGLKSTVLGLIDGLVQGAQRAWESMKQGVSDLVSNVTSIFDGIRNIDLWSAGKAILDGFLGGLKSAWDSVTDFVGGIAGWIRDHKGPIEYDRKLLIPAGNAIMQGLDRGLQDRFKDVKKSVSGMAGEISNAFSNDDFGLSGTPAIAKNIEASLAMPSAQLEAKDSQTVSEIAILRASMEKILTAILEKPSDTYLDADKISMSVYQRQGAIYAREGI
ncbi:phage tail protein [Streptococcus mitis]|uniref:Phage minor tail protein n=1 Tax=Streptococcus mitis TaxID=28037 RepID=A0A139PLD7_STRMT|nr:PblA [Streptococcus mitis]KXT90852.1 Phage minor tail protein [Streptococcus mitis]